MLELVYPAGGALTLLFVVLLATKRQAARADRVLAAWFGLDLFVVVTSYFEQTGAPVAPALLDVVDASALLHGVALWWYALALTQREKRPRPDDAWHLVPFLVILVFLLAHRWAGEPVTGVAMRLIFASKMLVLLGYGVATLHTLRRHSQDVARWFSYTERVALRWLQGVMWSLIVVWVVAAVAQAPAVLVGRAVSAFATAAPNVVLAILVPIMGFFGLRQTGIFASSVPVPSPREDRTLDESPDPEAADLPDWRRVQDHMTERKPFLDGYLTLSDLALQVDLPIHRLSELVNRSGGTTFREFVNAYRVEEVKRRLAAGEHRHRTLLGVGLDSGFNSKASFNRVFKQTTGQTPREYVQRLGRSGT